MEESVRLQYLEAMGIDVWVPRHMPVATQATEQPPEQVGWAEQSEAHHGSLDAAAIAEQREAHRGSPSDSGAIAEQNQTDHEDLDGQQGWAALHLAQPRDRSAHHADDHAWKELQHEVAICRACSLCETRTQTVFGVGNKHADWLLIGEAPGRDEDLQGEPFVGRAGQLLNEMIRAIGLRREQVYIANMLKCRPPNNRDPQADEVEACHGFLKRQIELIRPKLIVAVGRIAAQNLLKTQQPLSRLRGMRHELEGIPLTVVHHPAYLLRSPTEKAKAWEDLQFALAVSQSLQP